jgi:hypothetical protein
MGGEGRRFLRYVMPGLVFGVETIVFLLIVLPEPTVGFLANSGKDALASIVGSILAFGGLGYIFSSVNHWYLWGCEKEIFDHRKVIAELRKLEQNRKRRLNFYNLDEAYKKLDASHNQSQQVQREIAQSISLALWYHFAQNTNLPKSHFDLLGHEAYGLGAARIATVFAMLATLTLTVYSIIHGGIKDSSLYLRVIGFLVVIVMGCLLIRVFHKGYRRVAFFAHETYAMILMNECAKNENSVEH